MRVAWRKPVGAVCAAVGVLIVVFKVVWTDHPWQAGLPAGVALIVAGWSIYTDRRPERRRPYDLERAE